MARKGDTDKAIGQDADHATLLEIARLISESDAGADQDPDTRDSTAIEGSNANEHDPSLAAESGDQARRLSEIDPGDREADRLFEAMPSGLALCSGAELTRRQHRLCPCLRVSDRDGTCRCWRLFRRLS